MFSEKFPTKYNRNRTSTKMIRKRTSTCFLKDELSSVNPKKAWARCPQIFQKKEKRGCLRTAGPGEAGGRRPEEKRGSQP